MNYTEKKQMPEFVFKLFSEQSWLKINGIYPIFLFILIPLVLLSCNYSGKDLVKIEGETMGTSYHVSYQPLNGEAQEERAIVSKEAVDSLLIKFNNSVSTYIPTSTISSVNGPDTLIKVDDFFVRVFNKSQEISFKSDGAFDITVMPLVNAFGFGYTDSLAIDSVLIDSLLDLVDYRKIRLVEREGYSYVLKDDRRIHIDFGAIAKGYGVDLVAMLLEKNGIENYMVEIGGEVRVKGKNQHDKAWRIGIEKPQDSYGIGHQELEDIVRLENKSLATSGNYRNFYYRNGKKVSHEINPKTGYPALNSLLSVTVIADDCMTADGFATAFMVMGLEKTLTYLQKDSSVMVYLIYADENGDMKTHIPQEVKKLVVSDE